MYQVKNLAVRDDLALLFLNLGALTALFFVNRAAYSASVVCKHLAHCSGNIYCVKRGNFSYGGGFQEPHFYL